LTYGVASPEALPGTAVDIAAGHSDVYIINQTIRPAPKAHEGYQISKLDHDDTWRDIPDSPPNPLRIAVDKYENVWVVNRMGYLFSFVGDEWISYSGSYTDVVDSDSKIYTLDAYRSVPS
jgi:hypothetical protein